MALASVLGLSGCNGDPGGGDEGRAHFVSSLRPLEDGRLFARITSENTIGLFLDVKRHEAARLAVPAEREDWLWMLSSEVYLDGVDRAVLTEGLKAAGLLTAKIELTDPGG